MADVVLQNALDEEVTYEGVEAVSLTNPEGGTEVFVHEDLIPEGLPEVTEDDNGKVLGVVDGEWNAMEAEMGSALPEVTTGDEGKVLKVENGAWAVAENTGGVSSWNDLTDRPFYETEGEVLLAEGEYAFSPLSDTNAYKSVTLHLAALTLGETYIVMWDGVEYICECKDLHDINTSFTKGALYIGNAPLFMNAGYGENTGEPFFIAPDADATGEGAANTLSTDASHTISITTPATVQTLDTKYLPEALRFGEETVSTETDILAEQTVDGFAYSSEYGAYTPGYVSPPAFVLAAGETYKVVWDGAEYECVAYAYEYTGYNIVSIGNGSSLGQNSNDEPFLISYNIDANNSQFFSDTEATSHTVRIYQGGTETIVKTLNMKYLPEALQIGETSAVIFDGVFQDSLMDSDSDGVNDAWAEEMLIIDNSDTTLEVGKTYILVWDGVEYENECFLIQALPCVGNPAMIGGTDNGCPAFVVRDANNSFGIGNAWMAGYVNVPTDLTISGTYTCTIISKEVTQLDDKYLACVEVTQAGEVDIFPEHTWTYFALDSTYGCYACASAFSNIGLETFDLSIRDECVVAWDGVEYRCTVQDASALGDGYLALGNASGLGLSGNNEPFAIGWIPYQGVTLLAVDGSTETTHTVRIYQTTEGSTKIKESYLPEITEDKLPIMEPTCEEVYPETTVTLSYSTGNSYWVNDEIAFEANSVDEFLARSPVVTFDGTQYTPTLSTVGGFRVLGNLGPPGYGADTGEPFLLVLDGDVPGSIGCVLYTYDAAPEDTSATITHTVGISVTSGYTVKEEFLPEIVPSATTEDNGKFLMIVDGAPAWVSLTDVSQEGA